MRHNYQENKDRKIDNARDRADKNEKDADRQLNRAHDILSHIPLGQPILVGHHSEKRHRSDLKKADQAHHNAHAAYDKAAYYRERAAAMENNTAISSDDPEAIAKLEKKLELLTQLQEFMKASNKCLRKKDKAAFLNLPYGTEELWEKLLEKDCFGNIGFAQYKLTNNNAMIRNTRQRLEELHKQSTRTTTEDTVKGVRVVYNMEANRVQLFFPGKPSEKVRETLHQTYRFNWSGSEGAWQRFLNGNGIYAAKSFLEGYTEE